MGRIHKGILSLMLLFAFLMPADGQWFFLPNFTHDVRGLEERPEGDAHFYTSVPEKLKPLLEGEKLSEKQKKAMYWHPATFPHRDFVDIMPMRKVFGWYAREFNVPEAFAGMDILADLGVIDDSDETFVNGKRVGMTGKVPGGSAWQSERLYRISSTAMTPSSNYMAVHVWSLWGLGGIVGPPVLKAALIPEDAQWDMAFISDADFPKGGLNTAASLDDAMQLMPSNDRIAWKKASIPWKGYAQWKDDANYAIFRLEFDLLTGDGTPMLFSADVVLDMGAVFDVAAFYLNGKRVGLVGRFPEGTAPVFTEAAQRAQFIARPEDWSKDGHNVLEAIVYRERGIGGLPSAPGILLDNTSDTESSFAIQSDKFNILVQSGRLDDAQELLGKMKTSSDTERAWLLSHKAHLSFLKWLDGGRKDNGCLDGVIAPVAEILSELPVEAPKQSAMQAFCRVLRLAENDATVMSIVKRHFPSFSDGCFAMPPDRMTKGDWMLHYGEYSHALAAMGQVADWTGGRGQCKYRLYAPGRKDVPRYWLPNSQRKLSNPSAFIMHIPLVEASGTIETIGIKDAFPFLFPKLAIIRNR